VNERFRSHDNGCAAAGAIPATALQQFRPLAEQGNALAQYNPHLMREVYERLRARQKDQQPTV
jgi:hypothetical protein